MEKKRDASDTREEPTVTVPEKKRLAGNILLGSSNILFFGIIPFITILSPQIAEKIFELLGEGNVSQQIPFEHIKKVAIISQGIMSGLFIVSGAGLLARKEWARKFTVYFAFFIVAMTFISVLFNVRLVGQALVQLLYPGILIIYFTNKNVEAYFRK